MAFCKLLTVLVLMLNTEGLLGAEVRSSIVGGHDSYENSWPWMVHLNLSSNGYKWRCGGTILNNEWVMTSASCWSEKATPDLKRSMAWFGSFQLQLGFNQYMAISRATIHPYYQASGSGYVNDIALLKMKGKIRFKDNVKEVTLSASGDNFGTSSECWILGWGNIKADVPLPYPQTLQEAMVPIISKRECRSVYPEVTDDMLCAGDMAGGKDGCKGDYGGPLVCRTASSNMVQVGIMSYGSCGVAGQPGVYTKVCSYLDWISKTISRGEEASADV